MRRQANAGAGRAHVQLASKAEVQCLCREGRSRPDVQLSHLYPLIMSLLGDLTSQWVEVNALKGGQCPQDGEKCGNKGKKLSFVGCEFFFALAGCSRSILGLASSAAA
jgi:hypothetical protein